MINSEPTGFVWKIDENWTKDDVLHYLCEQRLKNYAPRLLPKIHKVRNLVYSLCTSFEVIEYIYIYIIRIFSFKCEIKTKII